MIFLDVLSNAEGQMTDTLSSSPMSSQSVGEPVSKRRFSPAALFYLAAFVAMIVFVMGGLRCPGCAGYQRGRFRPATKSRF